jgi:hypothetical protein
MPFSSVSYDPDTLTLLTRAYEDAWHELQIMNVVGSPDDEVAIRTRLAIRIMAAAREGERDPDRLKLLALQSIDGRKVRKG